MAVSVARPEDRVAAAIAFEEAAMAAVVEDLVDEETLETLRSTSDDLVSLTGLPSPGSLSAIGAPTELEGRGPLVVTLVAILVIGLAAARVRGRRPERARRPRAGDRDGGRPLAPPPAPSNGSLTARSMPPDSARSSRSPA